MLEKIGMSKYKLISNTDNTVLKFMDKVLESNPIPVFYEIGIGIGATTAPVATRMNNKGEIVLFSREIDVLELTRDLNNLGYTNINSSWGSPSKTYSGYHFELARGMAQNALPQFDLAYIDGGHVYHLDAPTACVLKELCKSGAYMLFDDWSWSMKNSPTMKPSVRPATATDYEPLQIETCHVKLVCKTIMNTDSRFVFLGLEGDTAVYQKK